MIRNKCRTQISIWENRDQPNSQSKKGYFSWEMWKIPDQRRTKKYCQGRKKQIEEKFGRAKSGQRHVKEKKGGEISN